MSITKANEKIKKMIAESQPKPSKFTLAEMEQMSQEPSIISSNPLKRPLTMEDCHTPTSTNTSSRQLLYLTEDEKLQLIESLGLHKQVLTTGYKSVPITKDQTIHNMKVTVPTKILTDKNVNLEEFTRRTVEVYGVITAQTKQYGRLYSFTKYLDDDKMKPKTFRWEKDKLEDIAHQIEDTVKNQDNPNYGKKYRVFILNRDPTIRIQGTFHWIDEENISNKDVM